PPISHLFPYTTLFRSFGPGIDAQNAFKKYFTEGGGEVVQEIRVPVRNPDFAPFLQRVSNLKPDAVFVFVPSGVGSIFMKQFAERDRKSTRLNSSHVKI